MTTLFASLAWLISASAIAQFGAPNAPVQMPPRAQAQGNVQDESPPHRPASAAVTQVPEMARAGRPGSALHTPAPVASIKPPAPAPVVRAPAPPAPPLPPVTGLPPDAPKLVINGGIYSERRDARAAIVNGQVVHEGTDLGSGVVLQEIRPDGVVLAFRGSRYTVVY